MDNTKGRLLPLVCLSHTLCHTFMLIFPLALVSIKTEYGFSFFAVGTLGMIGYLFFGIGSMPAGFLIDRFGPKQMLTIGIFGMSLSSLTISLAQSTAFMVFFGMLSLGCFASIHHPAALTMISTTFRKDRGKAFGIHAAFGSLGIAIAPLITGILISNLNWRYAYLASAIVGFVIALFSLSVDDPPVIERRAPGSRKRLDNPFSTQRSVNYCVIFILICFTSALFGLIYRGILTYLPIHFSDNCLFLKDNYFLVGCLMTFVLMFGAIGQYYGGVISDRLKIKEYGIIFMFTMISILLFGMAIMQNTILVILSGLLCILMFTFQPIQNYIIAESTQKRRRGISYGINYGVIFGFGSVATSIFGWLIDLANVNVIFMVMGGLAFLGSCTVTTQLILRMRSSAGYNQVETKMIPTASNREKKSVNESFSMMKVLE